MEISHQSLSVKINGRSLVVRVVSGSSFSAMAEVRDVTHGDTEVSVKKLDGRTGNAILKKLGKVISTPYMDFGGTEYCPDCDDTTDYTLFGPVTCKHCAKQLFCCDICPVNQESPVRCSYDEKTKACDFFGTKEDGTVFSKFN